MPNKINIQNIFDPIKKKIFSSPFGNLISYDFGLMQYTDRNSGKVLTQAVLIGPNNGYFWLVKEKKDPFWKNFQGGSPVVVKTQGSEYKGWAEIVEDPKIIKTVVAQLLNQNRQILDYLDEDVDISEAPGDSRLEKFVYHYHLLTVRNQAAI